MEVVWTKNHIVVDKIALFVYIAQCSKGVIFVFWYLKARARIENEQPAQLYKKEERL